MTAVPQTAGSGWQASLSLGFAANGQRTILARRRHQGPLVIQKPFYPEGEVCHVYLLHPPGGVVGGDELQLDVDVADDAHALITTPAAGKFYRSNGAVAQLQQHFRLADKAILEWLPQETILFEACRVSMHTKVELQANSGFIGWEILCLGRPASGERFRVGECRQCFSIWRNEEPLLIETTRLHGDAPVLQQAWGLRGANVVGTWLAVGADKNMLQRLREENIQITNGLFSASLINDVLICRALALQAEPARQAFIRAWQVVRPMLLNRTACPPRIWFT